MKEPEGAWIEDTMPSHLRGQPSAGSCMTIQYFHSTVRSPTGLNPPATHGVTSGLLSLPVDLCRKRVRYYRTTFWRQISARQLQFSVGRGLCLCWVHSKPEGPKGPCSTVCCREVVFLAGHDLTSAIKHAASFRVSMGKTPKRKRVVFVYKLGTSRFRL